MSTQVIERNADLLRLRNEGYELDVRDGYLIVYNIPYVSSRKEVTYGMLISDLEMAGNKTLPPKRHQALWTGEAPCKADGHRMDSLRPNAQNRTLFDNVIATFEFSHKPGRSYVDYFEKMNRYAQVISQYACSIDQTATAKTFRPVSVSENDSVFLYADTASTRAGISDINNLVAGQKIGIVGLGGTGSAILDLVAKTPVAEIHLFDDDDFHSHNAFRTPGATSLEELETFPKKVEYLSKMYDAMRRGVIPFPCRLSTENFDLLDGLDFVFICIDSGPSRKEISEYLAKSTTSFIDVGMGLNIVDGKICGLVRTTLSTPSTRDDARITIPTKPDTGDNIYATNIQVVELNALNAVHAVIRWKKQIGFYSDLKKEVQSVYMLPSNIIAHTVIES